ncbi:hypothetical protein ACFE04_025165 [Oxalis oulophora]
MEEEVEESSFETIVESKQELMVDETTPTTHILRTGHFLTTISIDMTPPPTFLRPPFSKCPLKLTFNGWCNPQQQWSTWIDNLEPKYKPTWKQAGIYNAIMGSKYQIEKHPDFILKLVERWSPKTNTFVFSWGEATITLQDMIVFGYSALGFPVFAPFEANEEMIGVEEELEKARMEVRKSVSSKKVTQTPWLLRFFKSVDSEVEHEAFLALWLSRFVLPCASDTVMKYAIPIAVRLARGVRIALGPAVLASIYRDLTLLKSKVIDSTCSTGGSLMLNAPFQLVLVWVWERFKKLQPNPNSTQLTDPLLARWHKVKGLKDVNVSRGLDSVNAGFRCRPFTPIQNVYGEMEQWKYVYPDSDEDLELHSFVRCLRASELVGINCIEAYFPNRVARQFGFDQDIPSNVLRCNDTPELAWEFYSRKPTKRVKIYIPSKKFEPNVTLRYLKWWKRSESDDQSPKTTKVFSGIEDNDVSVLHGFRITCKKPKLGVEIGDDQDKLTISEFMRARSIRQDTTKVSEIGDLAKEVETLEEKVGKQNEDGCFGNGPAMNNEPLMDSRIDPSSGVKNQVEIETGSAVKNMQCRRVSETLGEDVGNSAVHNRPGLEVERDILHLERIVDRLKKMPRFRKNLRRA